MAEALSSGGEATLEIAQQRKIESSERRSRYRLLHAGERDDAFAGRCALAIMSKTPRPGKVKTRLSPPLTLEQSAALNVCFLRDTARNIAEVTVQTNAVGLICYTPVGDEALFNGLLDENFALIAQRGEGFGKRLHAATEDILSCGFGSVCLIDSDSPTIPQQALVQAVRALEREGERAVLGPSADGGYYLIGLKQAHARPFECISWSTSSVFEETIERCAEARLEVERLPLWYDVDDAATLKLCEAELLDGRPPVFATACGFDAQATREFLRSRRAGLVSGGADEPSEDEVVA